MRYGNVDGLIRALTLISIGQQLGTDSELARTIHHLLNLLLLNLR